MTSHNTYGFNIVYDKRIDLLPSLLIVCLVLWRTSLEMMHHGDFHTIESESVVKT